MMMTVKIYQEFEAQFLTATLDFYRDEGLEKIVTLKVRDDVTTTCWLRVCLHGSKLSLVGSPTDW